MSGSVKDFITDWVHANVATHESHASDGGQEAADALAERCRSDASAKGIHCDELEMAVSDMIGGGHGLTAYMARALDKAADNRDDGSAVREG